MSPTTSVPVGVQVMPGLTKDRLSPPCLGRAVANQGKYTSLLAGTKMSWSRGLCLPPLLPKVSFCGGWELVLHLPGNLHAVRC
jgi:hypothetical protein